MAKYRLRRAAAASRRGIRNVNGFEMTCTFEYMVCLNVVDKVLPVMYVADWAIRSIVFPGNMGEPNVLV